MAVLTSAFASEPASPLPAVVPLARIATFAGDRAAAISYTFDDGLRDQYSHAAPLLDEAGFKGTFFIIPGRVSPDLADAERRQDDKRAWGTVTWDELRDLAARGHEIASHTWTHPNITKLPPEEIAAQLDQAANAIAREIGRPPLTLAFPFNAATPEAQALALRRHVAFRSAQFGVGGEKSTVESLNAWADKQVRDRSWGVVMAHGIVRGYAAFSDPEILRAHLLHVKSREADIWVDTFANVARYIKERDDARLSIVSTAPGRLVCILSGTLAPATYNVPLTIVFDAPGAVSVHAGRADLELPARIAGTVVHVDATPNPAPIRIAWEFAPGRIP